jgi:hypothetical protein
MSLSAWASADPDPVITSDPDDIAAIDPGRRPAASATPSGRWARPVFPVSVKGVAVQDGKVLLLENERHEWELPGGKLALREEPRPRRGRAGPAGKAC